MVYKWVDLIQSCLFPARCCLCLDASKNIELCDACRADLPWSGKACPFCAEPLPGGDVCPACARERPSLDYCHARFVYRPPIDRWVQSAKFNGDLPMARMLGELLADSPRLPNSADYPLLLPVPLHPRRLAQRGYNQSLEICRPLLANGYRLESGLVRRTRHAPPQAALPARARQSNIRGLFRTTRPLHGEHVLLIDDVMTTGATLNEIAMILKTAGAGKVAACVVARTLPRR